MWQWWSCCCFSGNFRTVIKTAFTESCWHGIYIIHVWIFHFICGICVVFCKETVILCVFLTVSKNQLQVCFNTAFTLAKYSRNLVSLDISWCRKLTDVALGFITDNCLSLKLLKIFGCTQVSKYSTYNCFKGAFGVFFGSDYLTSRRTYEFLIFINIF